VSAGANLFDGIPERPTREQVTTLVTTPGVRIERIVSRGQANG
jgi:hypothetical protein